ncbi:MAG: hypothetical protein H0W50_02020 [Parachlamydiaceae bacterium]|nr:hypothetical protein [Parachlamydiaceae bacterium]
MQLSDIQRIFNRALILTFSKKKLAMVSIILALCGLLIVFFRGLAIHAGNWIMLSLTFIPVFLCSGILLSAGIWLTRIYHDEVKNKAIKYRDVLLNSWEVIIGASYFAIPIILSYLLVWMTLGIFILLKEIPGVGKFFMAILAFAPFLLNLSSLLLCLFALLVLYFVTPLVALKGVNRIQSAQLLTLRLKGDVFCNIVLGLVAVLPLIFCAILLLTAAFITESMCEVCESPVYTIVHSFFIMIPFAVMLSPAVIFFFNFAAEAHVFMREKQVEE